MAAMAALGLAFQVGTAVVTAHRFGIEVDNINSLHLATGRWIAEHTPPGALIALDDIGGIAYISRRPVADMIGLVTPQAIAMRKERKSTADFLQATRPAYVATVRPHVLGEASALFEPIHCQAIHGNIAAVNDTIVVFEARWHHNLADRRP